MSNQEARIIKVRRPCPCCGWTSTILVITAGAKHPLYSIRCLHCGFESGQSRLMWRARYFWNHANRLGRTARKKRRYHLYGREF